MEESVFQVPIFQAMLMLIITLVSMGIGHVWARVGKTEKKVELDHDRLMKLEARINEKIISIDEKLAQIMLIVRAANGRQD